MQIGIVSSRGKRKLLSLNRKAEAGANAATERAVARIVMDRTAGSNFTTAEQLRRQSSLHQQSGADRRRPRCALHYPILRRAVVRKISALSESDGPRYPPSCTSTVGKPTSATSFAIA